MSMQIYVWHALFDLLYVQFLCNVSWSIHDISILLCSMYEFIYVASKSLFACFNSLLTWAKIAHFVSVFVAPSLLCCIWSNYMPMVLTIIQLHDQLTSWVPEMKILLGVFCNAGDILGFGPSGQMATLWFAKNVFF